MFHKYITASSQSHSGNKMVTVLEDVIVHTVQSKTENENTHYYIILL